MIKIFTDHPEHFKVPYTKFHFPGGELQVRVPDLSLLTSHNTVTLHWTYESDAELVELALLSDAIKHMHGGTMFLQMDYLPYARQDRVCSKGESFALDVFAQLINTLKFDLVICADPHNQDKFMQLFQNGLYQDQAVACDDVVSEKLGWMHVDYILFPDEGAKKKINQYVDILHDFAIGTAIGTKVRNPDTGVLTGFDINKQDFRGANVLIVDDICDGGGPFLGLGAVAKARNCGKLSLFTTHGIYSKGLVALEALFDGGVYCAYNRINLNVKDK